MKTSFSLGLAIAAAFLVPLASAYAQPVGCAGRSGGEGARIDEAAYVALGGLEQWVTIRGNDRNNPVLLHVHGGPGVAFGAFAAEFAPYEADFTVVQWDQRGAGCTFGRYGQDTPDVTLDRLANDGLELARQLRTRFGDRKIVLLGHSFGTIVATEMVRREPGLFALYVGTGQFATFAGPVEPGRMPPVDVSFMQRLQSRAAEAMAPPELAAWQQGRQASVGWLMQQVRSVDLSATANRVEVPFLVIQGKDDAITPTAAAAAYHARVDAPMKRLVEIEGAGHFAHITHAAQFLAALRAFTSPAAR
jgi:pimeloyl-ACP methyl ester carboxylesterase